MGFIDGLKPLFKTAAKNGIEHAHGYLCGLMQTTSPRGKNIERMEEAVPGLDIKGSSSSSPIRLGTGVPLWRKQATESTRCWAGIPRAS